MREVQKQQFHGDRNTFSNGHSSNNIGFFNWLRHPYKGLPYLLFSILFMLISLFFLFHHYLSNYNFPIDASKLSNRDVAVGGIRKLERFGESQSQSEMMLRIDELKTIKTSVNKELLVLEKKRQQLLTEIGNYTVSIENLKVVYKNEILESEKVTLKLNNLRIEFEEMKKNNQPHLEAPLQMLPRFPAHEYKDVDYNNLEESTHARARSCRMSNCFDFSRCSVFSQFPIYVYNTSRGRSSSSGTSRGFHERLLSSALKSHYVTTNPNAACLYVVFVNDLAADEMLRPGWMKSLAQIGGSLQATGTNHLLIDANSRRDALDPIALKFSGRALVAESRSRSSSRRPGYDLVLPDLESISSMEVLRPLPMMVPVKRKHFVTFVADVTSHYSEDDVEEDDNDARGGDGGVEDKRGRPYYSALDKIIKTLNVMQAKFAADNFFFEFACENKRAAGSHRVDEDFRLCGSHSERLSLLEQSTFSLVMIADHVTNKADYFVSTVQFQTRLVEALRSGAVPIIVGVKGEIILPYEDIIDWRGSILWVPASRITELHFMIRSFVDEDILEMRHQGRLIYETYFSSVSLALESLFSSVRSRLQIPPLPIKDVPTENYFNDTFPTFNLPPTESPENEEVLGPLEPPLDSPTFQRNFTSELFKSSENFVVPFSLFPHTPFRPFLSGDAKYIGSSYGFRPIGDGLGGSGKEFAEALGGDHPREQFTIVILTYEREAVLISAVAQFKGLPHLNKVVIIWNSDKAPSSQLKWPDIGVKVEAVKTSKNSLNNRFLPFDAIKTEAILSIDDDVHLRHDEIIFAFRVWRQARDRIVGFPGRFVSFYKDSNKFFYNSNYTCEMSMVLTGAAFLHKYYFYVYSYIMPQSIRDKVDEFLNCEDIAMNFLVSHITRKPPIKVTSRWTFKCPNCANTLYSKVSHFDERHQCITFFTQIYGYLPLLSTQYRADSILFKTRIPHDKQKCFRYI